MSAIRRIWESHVFAWLLTIVVAVHVAGYYWPTSWWVEHRSVRVRDGRVGDDMRMIVDREIKRPHRAVWTVSLHQQGSAGRSWSAVCVASYPGLYKPDGVLPDPLLLSWWSGGKCAVTEPGVYRIDTQWELHVWPLPRTVSVSSNAFLVTP